MRPIAATVIYLAFVFVGAALLAPWVYQGLQLLAMQYPSLRSLAQSPFHRYLNRCLIGLALIGLVPFLRALEIRSMQQLGFRSKNPGGEIATGIAWSLSAIAILAGLALLAGAHVVREGELRWAKHLRNAVGAALVVPIIEEVLFRAGLFGAMRRRSPFWIAAVLSSAIYALVHFFARPENPQIVEWHSGFSVLGQMLHGFTDWRLFFPAFFNLFLIGAILAIAYDRTGAIYLSIGLHAGFVFGAKSFPFLTNPAPNGDGWFWGSDKLVDGWAACGVLMLMLVLFAWRKSKSGGTA